MQEPWATASVVAIKTSKGLLTLHTMTQQPVRCQDGSTATVFGQGGLLDAGAGILGDLQSGSVLGLIGAAQKAARVNQTFKGKNLAAITKSEATTLGKNVVIGALPGATRAVANKADGWIFPQQQAARQGQTAGRNNPNPGA